MKCTAPIRGHRGDKNAINKCPVHGDKKNNVINMIPINNFINLDQDIVSIADC